MVFALMSTGRKKKKSEHKINMKIPSWGRAMNEISRDRHQE